MITTVSTYRRKKQLKGIKLLIILACLLLFAVIQSIKLGYFHFSFIDLWYFFSGTKNADSELVLLGIRLPRILLAVLVGAAFGVSGAIMQAVSQNALADPGILGINAGAGFGVVLYISMFYEKISLAPVYALPIFAFFGAFLAAVLVFSLARINGTIDPVRLVLTGVAVGSGIGAFMLFSTYYMGAYQYDFIKIWLTGNIWGTNWEYVSASFWWLLAVLPIVLFRGRILNFMQLGDEVAKSLGYHVTRERIVFMLFAVALAGSAVAVAGSIGFVGLIAPHLTRRLIGVDHRIMLPCTALVGGLLVLVADTIGRMIVHPVEIPVGVVVSGIGAPYFLYLLIKQRKKAG